MVGPATKTTARPPQPSLSHRLRLSHIGSTAPEMILTHVGHNVVYALLSYPAGCRRRPAPTGPGVHPRVFFASAAISTARARSTSRRSAAVDRVKS